MPELTSNCIHSLCLFFFTVYNDLVAIPHSFSVNVLYDMDSCDMLSLAIYKYV